MDKFEFKQGDRVRRINKDHYSGRVRIGEENIVENQTGNTLRLVKHEGWTFAASSFELVLEKLPDWIKVEPEKIIPAKKSFFGTLVNPSRDCPPLSIYRPEDTEPRIKLGSVSSIGYFTKKGVQEWIKALQELESHMDG